MYLSESDKKTIVEFLKSELDILFIYLFGSFARGEGRDDSDIDLAIYSTEKVSSYRLFTLGNELSFKLGSDIQIVDIKSASTVFAAKIIGDREELYSKDRYTMENFNMKTLSQYAKLNEEREVVIDEVERRGKVYG